ncbi:MAG TPA: hypothetical protein VFA52_00995 [Candidatus Paceibacterota bacterium]|nr:hypothetical protein [Candidatus Paceibacterota bacterium]
MITIELPSEVKESELGDKIPWLAFFLKREEAEKALIAMTDETSKETYEEKTLEVLRAIGPDHPVFVIDRGNLVYSFSTEWQKAIGIRGKRPLVKREDYLPKAPLVEETKELAPPGPEDKIKKLPLGVGLPSQKIIRTAPKRSNRVVFRRIEDLPVDSSQSKSVAENPASIIREPNYPLIGEIESPLLKPIPKKLLETIADLGENRLIFLTFLRPREISNLKQLEEKVNLQAGTYEFLITSFENQRVYVLRPDYPEKYFGNYAKNWDQWFRNNSISFAVRPSLKLTRKRGVQWLKC